MLIKEYDADEDGCLGLDESQQLILPATNLQLRTHVEQRPHASTYRPQESLSDELCKEIANLVQMELVF